MIEFFMAMDPPTKTDQQHRIGIRKDGTRYVYRDAELKKAKAQLMEQLSRFCPAEQLQGPVRLIVKWLFPKGRHRDGQWKTTRPDTDNLNKMLKDCMTELGYWTDDALVCSEIIEKFWAATPGIFIHIEQLEDPKTEGGWF